MAHRMTYPSRRQRWRQRRQPAPATGAQRQPSTLWWHAPTWTSFTA